MELAEGLEELGPGCFRNCSLRELLLPASLRRIGARAFRGCRKLRRVSFAAGSRLEELGTGAFQWTGLEEFAASSGLRVLAQEAFHGCGALRRVWLNDGLEVIGAHEADQFGERACGAFQESGVAELRLPASLKEVCYCAFKGCAGLRRVELPAGLERIGEEAFSRSGLGELALPGSLRAVGDEAFYRCAALAVVEVPEGLALEEAGRGVFTGTQVGRGSLPAGLEPETEESSEDE